MAAGALMSSPSMKVKDGSFPTHNKNPANTLLPSTGLFRYLKNVNFSHRRIILPVFVSSSSNPQSEETLLQDFNGTSNSDHVQVRFQLQRECIFGERFHIVGDVPKLGSWDPTSSIPMDWSEGHVWTVGLDDIPAGKKIQFKFILKDGGSQNISWQPGPDRILQTWVTAKTIIVSEDWDDAQLQTISEEDLALTNDLVFENEIEDGITAEEAVVEEWVSFVEQDLTLIEESVNTTTVVFKNLESIEDDILVHSESTPVLVPGLNPNEDEDDEDTMKDQIIQPNALDEANGSCSSNEMIETDTLVDQLILNGDEDIMDLRTEIEEEDNREGNVLENIIFGSKTLKKFLGGFGFLRKLST